MNGAEQMNALREAGFSDEEILSWAVGTRQKLSDAGFNEAEINNYFGKPAIDDAPIHGFFNDLFHNTFTPGEGEEGAPKPLSLVDALRAGFETSVTGLMTRGKLPDRVLTEQAPFVNRVASQVGTLAGDFPFMVVGSLAGGAMGAAAGTPLGPEGTVAGGIIGAGGGAFALPEGLRRAYIDSYQKGEIASFRDYWERVAAVGTDAWHGFVTGAATAGAGKLVPKGLVVPTEIATLVTVGNALEGEVPEPTEFAEAAVLVGGMHAARATGRKLEEIYVRTGKPPREVVADAEADPTIREDVLSDNHDIPRAYKGAAGEPAAPKPKPAPKPAAKDANTQAVLDRVSVGGKEQRSVTLDSVYRDVFDDLHPLAVAIKKMTGGEGLEAAYNAYKLARLMRGVNGKAEHFLEFSPFEFETYKNVGKPLKKILELVKDDLDTMRAFAVAKRTIELEGRGVQTGVPLDAAKATVAAHEAKLGGVFRELVEYQNYTLNYLRDSGLISAEMHKAMTAANQDYVPFFRFMEAASKDRAPKGLRTRQPLRRIKGSEREIVDPLESIIKNTYLYVSLAERNAVGRALVDLAGKTEAGKAMVRRAPGKVRPVKVSPEEIRKGLSEEARDLFDLYSEETGVKLTEEELTIFRPNALAPKENQIVVYEKGKRVLYDVDPELASTFKALDMETANLLVRVFATPAKLLRAGAVLAPEFIGRNPIRDQFMAFIFSPHGFRPYADLIGGIAEIVKKGDVYQDWIKSGGMNATLVSLDRRYLQQNLRSLMQHTNLMDAARNVVKSPVEMLRVLSDFAEQGTRLGEFKRATGGARTKEAIQKGGFASREVSLDFGRMGAKTRAVNMLVAFFNANLQGSDKVIRSFKDRPVQTSAKIFASITLPSVVLQILNRDEPGWGDIPQWQKDLFWLVHVGGTWYRIPKPFEVGILFGSMPERMVDYVMDRDPKAFDGMLTAIGRGATPGMIPTAAIPVIEAWANRSLFLDRPVIPRDREQMAPEYQYSTYTTELVKAMGKLTGTLPAVGDTKAASPAIIENYIRGWSGGLGMHIVNLADAVLRKAGVLPDPVKPARTLADIPFVKAFVVRHPSASAEPIQDFYDNFEEQQRRINTIKGLTRAGEFEDALHEIGVSRGLLIELGGVKQALSQSMKFIRLVYRNPDLSADEKRQLIDTAYYQMIEMAKPANEMVDELKKLLDEADVQAD